jgi:hypothetical protein
MPSKKSSCIGSGDSFHHETEKQENRAFKRRENYRINPRNAASGGSSRRPMRRQDRRANFTTVPDPGHKLNFSRT